MASGARRIGTRFRGRFARRASRVTCGRSRLAGPDRDGRDDQRPDARHRRQTATRIDSSGMTVDLSIALVALCFQLRQCHDQDLAPGQGIEGMSHSGSSTMAINLASCAAPCGATCPTPTSRPPIMDAHGPTLGQQCRRAAVTLSQPSHGGSPRPYTCGAAPFRPATCGHSDRQASRPRPWASLPTGRDSAGAGRAPAFARYGSTSRKGWR